MKFSFISKTILVTTLLSLSLTGCLQGDDDEEGGGAGYVSPDSSFMGEWMRDDVGCETVSLDGGSGNADSQRAVYIVEDNYVTYKWEKYTADTTCSGTVDYTDLVRLNYSANSNATGTISLTTAAKDIQRYVNTTDGAALLNAGGGSCGKTDWAASDLIEYDTNGFTGCTSDSDNGSFTFTSGVSSGGTYYLELVLVSDKLHVKFSADKANMGNADICSGI